MVFSQLVSAASIERGDAVYEPWLTNSELSAQLAPSRLPLPLPSPEPVESGRRTQHVSSGRGRGRPPGSLGSCTKSCTKYETVRAEPLGDGRERRYIAAWFPPGDDQKGRPVSAHTFRELTAEQLATCRTESYVVRLLGGLDDDARRKARASNSVQMSEAARRLSRPLEAAAKTSQHHRRTRERRAKLRDDDPEAARLAREADAHRKREKRANLKAARLAREADAERKRKERQK